eukprot:6214039-Pleurochrysis_carterae.AAC.1
MQAGEGQRPTHKTGRNGRGSNLDRFLTPLSACRTFKQADEVFLQQSTSVYTLVLLLDIVKFMQYEYKVQPMDRTN